MSDTSMKNRIEAARSLQAETDASRLRDDVDFWRHRRDVLGLDVTVDDILNGMEQFAGQLERDA